MTKYILCFRGTSHEHNALKEGLKPSSGNEGPVNYEGAIDPTTSMPMTPLLPIAAAFPLRSPDAKDDITTIDVLLIPIPEQAEEILESKIKERKDTKAHSKDHHDIEVEPTPILYLDDDENHSWSDDEDDKEKKHIHLTSQSYFVNITSIQKLDAIEALRSKNPDFESVYDTLGSMIAAHEMAAISVPKENVVASLRCARKGNSFRITHIEMQKDDIVNPDFIKEGYKNKLKKYLKNFLNKANFLVFRETSAYRGYLINNTEEKIVDYKHVHKDALYQSYLEQVQLFCDKNKIDFNHEDNLTLMQQYKDKNFDISKYCKALQKMKMHILKRI